MDPEIRGRIATSASGKMSLASLHGADAAVLEPGAEGASLVPRLEEQARKDRASGHLSGKQDRM